MTIEERDIELEALLDYLRKTRGFEFGAYKRNTLGRRIRRRMQDLQVNTFQEYQDRLEADPGEFNELFNTILINVTDFFRDPPAWEFFAAEVLPGLLDSKGKKEPFRAWSVGCSTGQEPYTLAMMLCEALGPSQFADRVKIYGTDLDEPALDKARHANYTTREVKNVPPPLLEKYFEGSNGFHTFRRDMRRSVIFGRHDLLNDAPISRVDILLCRNTLMYFNTDVQHRILARFHFALRDQGVLFLGKAESLLTSTTAFTSVNPKHRIFSKAQRPNPREHLLLMAHSNGEDAIAPLRAQVRARDAAFDATPQAHLVIDNNGTLALVNERARVQFGLTFKDLGRPVQDLQVSYDPVELRQPISRVLSTRRPEMLRDVAWRTLAGETRWLDVQVIPLDDPDSEKLLGFSVQFTDNTQHKVLEERLVQSNQALETTSEELQSTNEELETTNEELQSTIEELETTNEELQSSNEELETMNEELQSSNEELETLNSELSQRTLEVNLGKSFLESILEGLESGIVVVDQQLRVLEWNRKSTDLWGLRADEVRGKYFFGLDFGLPVDSLQEPLQHVLGGQSHSREITLDAINRLGKSIRIKTVCSPFRDPEGVIIHIQEV